MSIFEITDTIGIAAFALSGYWVGAKERLDLLGAFIASFLTALGGGVIRDIIVGNIPYSFHSYFPVTIVLLVLFLSIAFDLKRYFDFEKRKIFIISDSVGLVSFAITGALVGIEKDLSYFGVVLLALITAVGGGVLRDMLLNRVPMILTSDFYGSVAIICATLLFFLDKVNFLNDVMIVGLLGFGIGLRIIAYFKKWQLPKL